MDSREAKMNHLIKHAAISERGLSAPRKDSQRSAAGFASLAIAKTLRYHLWGKDFNDFNTVAKTTCVKFWMMQMFRMVSSILLAIISFVYFFIYVRQSFGNLTFYSLLFSTLAFANLFTGAGRQKCYQLKLVDPDFDIDYNDPTMKKDFNWLLGVSFYTISFPLSIISTILYFVRF